MTRLDPLLAFLLLLPAAWLAIPSTLEGQLEPELSATGWWILLQLAPALLLVARKSNPQPRPTSTLVTLLAAFVALSLASSSLLDPPDTLSASRAVLIALASWSAFTAASTLGPTGRRVLSFGILGLSLALTIPALLDVAPRVQGALQNSGATSEAALPGALAALAVWLFPGRAARVTALSAIVAYGVFVARAPVIAGALVFATVALLVLYFRSEHRRRIAVALGVFALAAVASLGFARVSAPAAETPESAAAQGHLGGLAVRLAIAPATLAMFADHPWLGVGPGQFRASFPPYRDELERTASDRANPPGRETEVEHAHNDVLTTLAEVGLLGALAWSALLLALSWRAIRALQSTECARVALGLAVLGGVANTLLRAPLTFNPASASLFFAAGGALVAQDVVSSAPRLARRGLALLGFALLALQAPRAWNFVRHGDALRLPGELDLPAALAACPDSPLALSLTARRLAADPTRAADARAAWERVLALRPWNFEASMQAGVLAANAGDLLAARGHWERALEVAPERTGLLQNLLLLEARLGDDDSFARAEQRAQGRVPRSWSSDAGAQELLEGDERAALRLWRFAGADWLAEPPEALYQRSRDAEEASPARKSAWEMLAHLRWARDFATTGDFASSVRSYRQALRLAPEAGSVRLELAAALWSAGKPDDARAEIERANASTADWTRLAPWAGDVLLRAGLFAAR